MSNKTAFTLVELSLVLIIIGLLVAAIIAGKSLLISAETKTLLSEVQKLNVAIGNFQSLYKGLPGDISNATSYWSGTANGDNSGKIDSEASATSSLQNESFRGIQQLSLANLLEGSYATFAGTWPISSVNGFVLTTPATSGNALGARGRNGAGLYIRCCSGPYSTANYDFSRTLTFNNHISLFSVYAADITKRSGILTPIEAYDIDKKIDDGKPDTGLVGASGSWTGSAYAATGCYSGSGSSSTYDTAVAANKNAQNCQMQFGYDWE